MAVNALPANLTPEATLPLPPRSEVARGLRGCVFAGFRFREPSAPEPFRRNIRQIRINVENRCAIEHVQTAHAQPRPFTAQQLDYCQPDRIRPARRARCEHAVRTIVTGRSYHQLAPF